MRIKLDIPLSLAEIICATSGVASADAGYTVTAISTDSRLTERGDLFIALVGKFFDGRDFIEDTRGRGAITLGACAAADIIVDNSEAALLNIASLYKTKLQSLRYTVAITGSIGKTTTKEFLRAITSGAHITHANFENYNNALGVAHTILSAPRNTEILITELGMNHAGEISALSRAVKPDVAVITCIGTAHIGNFGSRELLAKAKLEINDGMTDGKTVVPLEEPLLEEAQGRYTVSLLSPNADAFLIPLFEGEDKSFFDFYSKKLIITRASISVPGRHNLYNVAMALAVASLIGIPGSKINLGDVTPSLLRQKWIRVGSNTVYDDTYSSSPEAVIGVLKEGAKKKGEHFAVLADMLELGAITEAEHYRVGKAAAELGYSRLFLFGVYSPFFARGAVDGGLAIERIHMNTDTTAPEITAEQIKKHANGAVIVVKGSHALHAERIISLLRD